MDMAIAHLAAHKIDIALRKSLFQTKIAHDRSDNAAIELAGCPARLGQNKQNLITVHPLAPVVNKNHPVTVTIKGQTQIGLFLNHPPGQRLGMGRAAVTVDVEAVGLEIGRASCRERVEEEE